jgi:hypothetical protein
MHSPHILAASSSSVIEMQEKNKKGSDMIFHHAP